MKKLYYILSLAFVLVLTSCSFSRDYAQPVYLDDYGIDQQTAVTYQQFYDELSPYGNWISYPGYGYAWAPRIAGFSPYSTNGYWVYTTFGWTWMSNYRWGWAPFHYGRWLMDARYGWLWIPGYEWAPAWVAWRGGGGYYGWAPLGPGMSINISIGTIPYHYWNFVPNRYIGSRNIGNYYVNSNTTIINNTTVINNNYYNNDRTVGYNTGPGRAEVEKVTNTKIAPVRVIDRSAPGTSTVNNNELSIYRPQMRELGNSTNSSRVMRETDNSTGTPSPVRSLSQAGTAPASGTNNGAIREIKPAEQPSVNMGSRVPSATGEREIGREINTGNIRSIRPSAPVQTEEKKMTPAVRNTSPVQNRTITPNTSSERRIGPTPVHIAPPRTADREILRSQAPVQQRTISPQKPAPASRSVSPDKSSSGGSRSPVRR